MANRFWINGTGNWSDSSHWSTTSGGVGGASVPTSVDDVFIDDNSGGSGFVLTCDLEIYFKNILGSRGLSWVLNGTFKKARVYGNIYIGNNCNILSVFDTFYTYNICEITIKPNEAIANRLLPSTTCIINSNVELLEKLYISDINASETFMINGNYLVKTSYVVSALTGDGELVLNSSTLELNYQTDTDISALNLNAGTSTLRLLDSSRNFESGSLTWHNVDLQGDNITINGSPTINQLKATTGNTVNIQASQTITLSNLDIDGCSLIGLT